MFALSLQLAQNLVAAPAVVAEPWRVTAREPHSAVWESVHQVTNEETGATREEKHSYVELATGLNYLNPATRQYEPSEERFVITPQGGAVAAKGQHQLRLAANINSGASVDLLMPDGQRLLSNPMGLSFFDSASGKNVLLAEVKDCVGELVAPNVILYRDAFDSIRAGIRYTYTRSGISQDIILYQNPGSPAEWGLDPSTTRLVMYTEFHNPPVPQKTTNMITGSLNDEPIGFGPMQIAKGLAYFQNQESDSARVLAQWVKLEGRDFLAETVPFRSVQPMLEKLQAAVRKEDQGEWAQRVLPTLLALLGKLESKRGKQIELAAAIKVGGTTTEPVFILDYPIALTSQSGVTLMGDTTYYVSGTVNLSGTTTLEGGCVVKFEESPSAKITLSGQLQCKTSRYRPAIFTSKFDGTVGEDVAGGTPGIGHGGIAFNSSGATLSNVRFLYASNAVSLAFSPGQINVANVQFVNCQHAINSNLEDQNTILLDNALFNAVTYGIKGGRDLIVRGEHLTVDRCDQFGHSQTGGDSYAYLTNCLLVAVTNWGSDFTFITNSTVRFSNDPGGIFQTVGFGYHYLADDSYRNVGTTNIDPTLANEIKSRTTYAPMVLTSIPYNMTLMPQAGRDTDTPDLGFHYAPLDYFACGVGVASNVTVLVTNGAAIGIDYSTSTWGFVLTNAKFICTGDALNLNYVVRAHTVQEKSGGNPGTRACFCDDYSSGGSRDCEVRMRFTEFDQLSGDGWMTLSGTKCGALEWTHSRLYGAVPVVDTSGSGTLVCGLTNSLWERGTVLIGWTPPSGAGVTAHVRNNLIRNVIWHFLYGNTNWTVRDNLFDHPVYLGDHGSPVANSHNGYDTNTALATDFTRSTNTDIIVTNFDYQAGPLGNYYYPTNGGHLSRLLDMGSQNATNAGLYHFTSRFDQLKETNSTVDIGLHYPAYALGASGGTSQGLVGYWTLDNTAADSSGNGNNGALQGDATWAGGQIGSGALSLDGSGDYVSILDDPDLKPDHVTVAAWFNANNFSSTMTVVTKPLNGPAWAWPYLSWLIRINNSTTLEIDVGNGSAYSAWSITVPTLQTGRWYHVALTYDGTSLTAYLDGNSLGTHGTVTGNLGYGNKPVLFGADYGASSLTDFLAGKIDDVRIYNRALSSAEILGLITPSSTQLYDSDNDGVFDYLEDANGNGSVDTGETDWQNANDLGLKVLITRPKSNSVIP